MNDFINILEIVDQVSKLVPHNKCYLSIFICELPLSFDKGVVLGKHHPNLLLVRQL